MGGSRGVEELFDGDVATVESVVFESGADCDGVSVGGGDGAGGGTYGADATVLDGANVWVAAVAGGPADEVEGIVCGGVDEVVRI